MVASLFVVASVDAQERRPCIGTVRGPDGAAIAAVTVTAVYASPGDPTFLNDRQVAVTDERGRFRLPLWSGVTYDYWAIGRKQQDGSRLVSKRHAGATGGGYIDVAAVHRQTQRSASIPHFAAWRKHGAVSLTVHGGPKDVLGMALAVDDGGSALLPSLPSAHCMLRVADARGRPLALGLVGPGAEPEVQLGKPRVLDVQYPGEVPEGARLRMHLRAPVVWNAGELWVSSPYFYVRDLDAYAGPCKVVVPNPPEVDPSNFWWQPSMMTLAAGGQVCARLPLTSDPTSVNAKQFDVDGVATLYEVTDVWPVGGAAPGERYLCLPRRGDAPWTAIYAGFVVDGESLRRGMLLEKQFAGCDVYRRGSGTRALELFAMLRAPVGEGDLSVATGFHEVEVTITDDRGGPGGAAWVTFQPLGRQRASWSDEGIWARADSGGRVRVQLPEGRYGVHATDGRGLGARELQVDKKPVRLRMALEAMTRLRVRLLDAQDQPVVGARGYSMVHGSLGNVDGLEAQRHRLANALAYRLCVRHATDEKGDLTIPLVPFMGNGGRLRLRLPDGGNSEPFALEPSDELVTVR